MLKILDEKISQAKAALARACSGPRPKGVGALSQMQLQSEVLDWRSYTNRRKIACLAGSRAWRVRAHRRLRTAWLHY